ELKDKFTKLQVFAILRESLAKLVDEYKPESIDWNWLQQDWKYLSAAGKSLEAFIKHQPEPLNEKIANVLAVPVAGLVMLIGLPLALFAGMLNDFGFETFAQILMWPIQVGVRWVWWVAEIFARLRFDGALNFAVWVSVFAVIIALRHRSSSV
ncbi:MAG: hypothetical protein EBV40_06560, partial [Actinobacteria bacterium]|nr:hypothetical protein [Actinomycetota bacterium]